MINGRIAKDTPLRLTQDLSDHLGKLLLPSGTIVYTILDDPQLFVNHLGRGYEVPRHMVTRYMESHDIPRTLAQLGRFLRQRSKYCFKQADRSFRQEDDIRDNYRSEGANLAIAASAIDMLIRLNVELPVSTFVVKDPTTQEIEGTVKVPTVPDQDIVFGMATRIAHLQYGCKSWLIIPVMEKTDEKES